jgi:hypothetical protein
MQIQTRQLLIFSLTLTTAVVAFSAAVASSSAKQPEHRVPQSVKEYPLWKVVPVKAFAVLGEGYISNVRWGIYAYRDGPRTKPCIVEANLAFNGLYSSTDQCGGLAPPSREPISTITTSSSEWPNGRRVEYSVIGFAVGAEVNELSLDLRPGRMLRRRTRLLSQQQAHKARLQQFRYLTVSLARKVCVNQVSGFSDSGAEVISTAPSECRA